MNGITPSGGSPVSTKKLFVLDTNVLMLDPSILFRLDEHDVLIPEIVLEELDEHKTGLNEINRNTRTVNRYLDELMVLLEASGGKLHDGIPLKLHGNTKAPGRLFFQSEEAIEKVFAERKNDNLIIELALHHKTPRGTKKSLYADVVVLTNDINVRIKARTRGLTSEGIRGDIEIADEDLLPGNIHVARKNFWEGVAVESKKEGSLTSYTIGKSMPRWKVNDLVELPGNGESPPFVGMVVGGNKESIFVRSVTHYSEKRSVWGIAPKNREQNFAFNLLMDSDISFVALAGAAGTGKTLLTLAAGLEQVMEKKRYNQIIVTRATVPLDRDIGFLPGTEEEKMGPWMGALSDNLEVLLGDKSGGSEWGKAATRDLVESHIKIKSLNFMRGRSFNGKFVIIDEAQNLTQKQAKALVTRAGPDTKIIFLGNVAQIDTPYLSEINCGLVQAIHRFRKAQFPGAGFVILEDAVRSALADAANKYL